MTREEMERSYLRDLTDSISEANGRIRALRLELEKSLARESELASTVSKLQRMIGADVRSHAPGEVLFPQYHVDEGGNWRKVR